MAALTNAFGRPILFKNLYAPLRIQAIAHHLPESLFIITHRDEVDNGHSLLEVRKKVFGSYHQWWSMEPPDTESLKRLPAHQQVKEQIRHQFNYSYIRFALLNIAVVVWVFTYIIEFSINIYLITTLFMLIIFIFSFKYRDLLHFRNILKASL